MTNTQILIGGGLLAAIVAFDLVLEQADTSLVKYEDSIVAVESEQSRITFSASSEPRIVLECVDSTDTRISWADRVEECPSGTTPEKHTLTDACDPPSAPKCSGVLACEPGTPGCPTPQPAEYLCCAAVSGEPDCWIVSSAVKCDGDELLFECKCAATMPDGSTDCVAAC